MRRRFWQLVLSAVCVLAATVFVPLTASSPQELKLTVKDKGVSHVLCIDGGGTKTSMQVVNHLGAIEYFYVGRQAWKEYLAGSSNFSEIGQEGMKSLLKEMIQELYIDRIPVMRDPGQYAVVAGFAGAGRDADKEFIKSLFVEMGFKPEHVVILTDAELALYSVGTPGVILIAGTGSICLGYDGASVKRAGGLGKVLGDEGSGYAIGREAIKAALEDEYGWGSKTSLTETLRKKWNLEELKQLISPITNGVIKKDEIAAVCPLVFEEAMQGDPVANHILDKAADHLSYLLSAVLQRMEVSECPVYLVGGVWKNSHWKNFLARIEHSKHFAAFEGRIQPKIVNQAGQNFALLAAQMALHGE